MTGRGGRGRGNRPRDAAAAQQPAPSGPGQPYSQMGGAPAAAPQPQAARPPQQSAWGPPAGTGSRAVHRAPSAQPGAVAAVTAGMSQVAIGRPQGVGGAPAAPPAGGNGNGGGNGAAGRGAIRGGRVVDPALLRVKTKPSTLKTKQGSSGQSKTLFANYFRINTVPDWVLHQYRVDIAPEEDRTRERRFLLRVHKEQLGGYLFDGTVLYTANRLTTEQHPVLTLTSKNSADQTFTITVRHVGQVDFGDYAYVQVFNLLLRTCIFSLDLKLIGRDYFDPEAMVNVPEHRLELWPGYKTSIRQHEKDILMCVEIAFKVMRNETAYDILRNCQQQNPQDFQAAFGREMIGCVVLTKYNNKTYRVDDIAYDINPSNTFKMGDEEVSYAQYMERKYQIRIRDMRQPMLISRAKARDVRAGMAEIVHLIPEVCFCTGITDAMRANPRMLRDLSVHTRVNPTNRIAKLRQFNQRLQNSAVAMAKLKEFGMGLDKDLVKLTARTVPPETIIAGGRSFPAGEKAEWQGPLGRAQMLSPKNIQKWVVLVTQRAERDVGTFIQALQRAASGMGCNIGQPQKVALQRDNAGGYVQALTSILDAGQPEMIMCVLNAQKGDVYSAIKKKCCADRAVPTQVILSKNLNNPKNLTGVASKVAIQMVTKVGGAPWSVAIPAKGVMVVGFDVCHDTSNKKMSFGAMVASLDQPLSRYYSAVSPHQDGTELSHNLALNLVKAMRKYQQVNGTLPEKIIIYRDGVGEGQIPMLMSTELESIKRKLGEVYGSMEAVKMAFIIVTKRINTRVFTEQQQNPPPGTIVDDVVTDPEKYDFFLISQSVREGTVTPTSFNVVHDTIMWQADIVQRLTFKLCHVYFNWSGTVRVPAPCQYAHKLAFLVGQAIHREPNSQLEDLLYFL